MYEKTGTILDNYTTRVAFTRDHSVTEQQLIDLVNHEPYIGGTCRYVGRHPNCTKAVVQAMTKHPKWFVRIVGYFHYKFVDDKEARDTAMRLVLENKEDKHILNLAQKIQYAFVEYD